MTYLIERKNPTLEAIKFTGDNSLIVEEFTHFNTWGFCKINVNGEDTHRCFLTSSDSDKDVLVKEGDYIVKKENGVYKRFSPEEFLEKFEILGETP